MKRILIVLLLLSGGCARFGTKQIDQSETYDPKTGLLAEVRTTTTKASAYTLWNAKSQLANWKATQSGKSQGASVGGLSQEASDTNILKLAESVARGVAAGLSKP